jgi:(p)ppGpp synthase/HD superfamily hydrolase
MSDSEQPLLKADTSEAPIVLDPEAENKEILKRYRALLKACKTNIDTSERKLIRKAFDISLEAHKDMRRKSGEPYIFHPIAVATIVAEEIGLGALSIVCALLHDVVEDTDYTLEDLEKLFNKKVAGIVDGLTKISGVFDHTSSLQAENFRKMLLTMSDDVRVILIKIADRLHNMRTLGSMPKDKQLKIASETAYLYAPLAHRLGLYSIKTELDDLVQDSFVEALTSLDRLVDVNAFSGWLGSIVVRTACKCSPRRLEPRMHALTTAPPAPFPHRCASRRRRAARQAAPGTWTQLIAC